MLVILRLEVSNGALCTLHGESKAAEKIIITDTVTMSSLELLYEFLYFGFHNALRAEFGMGIRQHAALNCVYPHSAKKID